MLKIFVFFWPVSYRFFPGPASIALSCCSHVPEMFLVAATVILVGDQLPLFLMNSDQLVW